MVIKQALLLGVKANTGVKFAVQCIDVYNIRMRTHTHTTHYKTVFSVRICTGSGFLARLLVYTPASPLVLEITGFERLSLIKRPHWNSL